MATKKEDSIKEPKKTSAAKPAKTTKKPERAAENAKPKTATPSNTPKTQPQTEKTSVKPKAAATKIKIKKTADSPQYYGTGKRKNAIARVWLFPGEGRMEVNQKEGKAYLKTVSMVKTAQLPLSFLNLETKFNVMVRVRGGGISGQASAINAGLAKALVQYDSNLHKQLKEAGFLTRDARIKESKLYGHKRARKSFQYSKR